MIKNSLNKLFLIVGVLVNVFLIGNTLVTGWRLTWPKVPGKVISEEVKIQRGSLRLSSYKQYLLFVTYEYVLEDFSYQHKILIDVFDSKQVCDLAQTNYQNKMITVYVNPSDHNNSVTNPGNDFINALMSNILMLVFTVLLLYIMTRHSNFSEGSSNSWATPQW